MASGTRSITRAAVLPILLLTVWPLREGGDREGVEASSSSTLPAIEGRPSEIRSRCGACQRVVGGRRRSTNLGAASFLPPRERQGEESLSVQACTDPSTAAVEQGNLGTDDGDFRRFSLLQSCQLRANSSTLSGGKSTTSYTGSGDSLVRLAPKREMRASSLIRLNCCFFRMHFLLTFFVVDI